MSGITEAVKQNKLHEEIKNIYSSGCKPKSEWKVGVEYERLPINNNSFKAVDYFSPNGICNFLRIFASNENWDYILDGNEIIGLKQGHDTLTLEPGCQVEFSLEPQKNLAEIKNKINKLDLLIAPVLDEMDISLINYGVSPVSTNKTIKLIPKKRYAIMAKYLWGIFSDVMMRETAGIQGTFDFSDEEDGMRKFKIANMLSPFMTAMFANSPIRGGVDTGYKSFRALSWLNTDNDRCGYAVDFTKNITFDDYIKYVSDVPMLFINRFEKPINFDGRVVFSAFSDYGYMGYGANIDDYLLQANLCFPEVRLSNYIEIRNHDGSSIDAVLSMLAIYKGILYNTDAMNSIEELLSDLTLNDYSELRYNVPKYALATPIKNYKISDYAPKILEIARTSLRNNFQNEDIYLNYISELVSDKTTQADIILRNWNGIWNKDVSKLINHIS